MSEISPATQRLIQRYQLWFQSLQTPEGANIIHVDEVASKVAAFYENIRGIVDWREEHLMRRAAIERVLERRFLLFKNILFKEDYNNISDQLVIELIRGGHLPNDRITEDKIEDVKKRINKYIFILETCFTLVKEKQRKQFYKWIIQIASCEIEETLSLPYREKALIKYMTELMQEKIKVREGVFVVGGMNEEEKNTQVCIAVQRALFKLDNPIITYNLFKSKYPDWKKLSKDNPQLHEIANNIVVILKNIEKDLNHPLSGKLYKICEKYDTPYLIIGDIISENPLEIEEKIKNSEDMERMIISAYQKRLKIIKTRTKRAAIYATLSILISKVFIALFIETNFDKQIVGQINYIALAFNIFIPLLLMCLLVFTIKPPAKENLQQVVIEVMKIAYKREKKDSYFLSTQRKKSWIINAIVTIFYFLSFVFTFGLIIIGLKKLNFTDISVIIFLFFISLISFAGIKLRERAKELEVIERKDSFLLSLFTLISLPIIQIGKWLSSQLIRYNIIVVVFNFLIDAPFQIFLEFLEQWRTFLKEKREEIH